MRSVEAVNAREVNEALLTDDFEIVNASTAVTDKTYRGASGAREWMHDFFDVLDENARFEITEIVEADEDYLVVRNRLVGTGSASGAPFDMEWFSAMVVPGRQNGPRRRLRQSPCGAGGSTRGRSRRLLSP